MPGTNPRPRHDALASTSQVHNWTWAGQGQDQCALYDSAAAVNVFYHINSMWDYFAELGYSAPVCECIVNVDNGFRRCQAGVIDIIRFYIPGDELYGPCNLNSCANPAFDSDVIYHEYTHHVAHHYSPLSEDYYYENVMEEALADYFACSKIGDSDNGEGFVGPTSADTRHLDNTYHYPRDWAALATPPISARGQIVSGSGWDLRTNLGAGLADWLLLVALGQSPLHYFHHLAINVLEADGYQEGSRSPHYEDIAQAFAKHGIHFPTAPANLAGQASPYSVPLSWSGSRGPGRHPGSIPDPDSALTASDTTRIVAYRVFRGLQSQTYTDTTDFPGLSGTISGLMPGVTYYFAVAAVDSYGVESAYSNEISKTIPGITASAQDDSLFVCPGWDGDSLVVHVAVYDSLGAPIDSIPADSIYARVVESTGNALFCYGSPVTADSMTNSSGKTSISVLQMGGCGSLGLQVVVHTAALSDSLCPDTLRVWLRSPDIANADCEVTSQDQTEFSVQYSSHAACSDLNWDGFWTSADSLLFSNHYEHPIAVVAPDGGEIWVPGTQHEIQWVDGDGTRNNSHVTLALSKDGGASFPDTIAQGETNDGSYSWSIPADAETLHVYRVKAIGYDDSGGYMTHSAADTSDADFTITWGTPFCGTISTDTTWSGLVAVPCDIVVASGAELTLSPGCVVRFATSDSSHSGIDTTKCELIVQGTLVADGSLQSKVTFISATASPSANDWRGIRLRPGSANNLVDNCIIKYSYTGIEACSTTVTVDSCTISNFSNDGIKAIASTVTLTRDSILVGSTGVRGIELASLTSGTVEHNTITGSSSGVRYGIEVKDYFTEPDITYNWIDGLMHGIKCTDGSPVFWHNRIQGSTGNGIQCSGEAAPSVRYTTIENFQGTAVTAADYVLLNLGAYPDSGSNRIYTSQSFSYYVANLAQNPISAEYNWWGTSSPSSGKFYGGVDYSPCDASDPGTSYALPFLPVVSPAPGQPYAMQSYPNPFNPRTTIEYGVSEPGTQVRIIIYDILGRAVKLLVDKPHPSGRFSAVWDGRNERGEVVASGVYFYEVTIGDFREAKKLVVLK